ncbi:MarR family winged helix-turn-helix transcriptional regulator [Aeromicrobium sp. IC_218]|uniref:MarR family winged helix-turn-helix transcriptional regulator n=1 Tax=Aeromicrobium sp. IC_218 TaxID=2545468 RepID=UPI00103E07B7|nr:MarR family winged helix-turn-helix transcriptional regulator [Aeromicrobium sp. IC_218]TCJ00690.1 MarR family transcriptional regulator [Aeromicrobium sp. IC_218]
MTTTSEPATGPSARRDAVEDVERQLVRMMSDSKRRFRDLATQVHPDLHAPSLALLIHLVREGEQPQGALAAVLHADKGQVSRLVTQLVDLGLVVREPDPADRRAMTVAATDQARRRIDEVGWPQRRMLHERLGGWQLDDVRELAELLRRLNDDERS